jgi:hypothetical protein
MRDSLSLRWSAATLDAVLNPPKVSTGVYLRNYTYIESKNIFSDGEKLSVVLDEREMQYRQII